MLTFHLEFNHMVGKLNFGCATKNLSSKGQEWLGIINIKLGAQGVLPFSISSFIQLDLTQMPIAKYKKIQDNVSSLSCHGASYTLMKRWLS